MEGMIVTEVLMSSSYDDTSGHWQWLRSHEGMEEGLPQAKVRLDLQERLT
jgi:hypothetical protein